MADRFKGIPISPGVAIGTAFCVDDVLAQLDPDVPPARSPQRELARLDRACAAADTELQGLYRKVASQVGQDKAAIFQAHETILRDTAFVGKIRHRITEDGLSATVALRQVMVEYTSLFAKIKDDYLKERLADLRDVITRISAHLRKPVIPAQKHGSVVLVAQEVLPSQTIAIGRLSIAGIVTELGGATSHAAILARSLAIPAVSGLAGILGHIKPGDMLVVDGRDGHLLVNPGPEAQSSYRKLQREFVHLKHDLASNRDQPAVSADGQRVELLANVNNPSDAQAAAATGAVGVGLYRTEYLFLTHPGIPDEEEQLQAYRQLIEAAPNRCVTIRTLDLGGDKTLPYLGHRDHREANPFLGWRSIRLSFEHPELFRAQVRAILRAGCYGRVQMMFPMITTPEELWRVKRIVSRAKQELQRSGIEYGEDLPIGLMLEVPAAALVMDSFLPHVDFVCIGSNDLVQYLTAADRDNPKVAHLYQPLSLPVLKLLEMVISACDRAGCPVTLCGEMAACPRAFMLLFAMGLRRFSLSPPFIPSIKELLSHLTREESQALLRRVLRIKTTRRIRECLSRELQRLCPKLALLDIA